MAADGEDENGTGTRIDEMDPDNVLLKVQRLAPAHLQAPVRASTNDPN